MKTYYKKILEIFADAYPDSAQLRGGRKLRKAGWEKIFPDTTVSDEKKNLFLDAVELLCTEKIISAKWKKYRRGDELSAIYLEDPEKIYTLLGRSSPEEINADAETILTAFQPVTETAGRVKNFLLNEMSAGRLFTHGGPGEINDILVLTNTSPGLAEKYSIRALSVKLYKDSKRLEKIIKNADKISITAGDERLSEILNLERKFPDTAIAGRGSLCFKDGRLWALDGSTVILPEKTVFEIEKISFTAESPRILSVENKESFSVISSLLKSFDLFFYCGGRLNRADRAMLNIIAESDAEIYHAGDLDPDGLEIFNDIDSQVGGRLIPYRMDADTYKNYIDYGYPLNKNVLDKIKDCRNTKMSMLAAQISTCKIGVEQEIIDYEKNI